MCAFVPKLRLTEPSRVEELAGRKWSVSGTTAAKRHGAGGSPRSQKTLKQPRDGAHSRATTTLLPTRSKRTRRRRPRRQCTSRCSSSRSSSSKPKPTPKRIANRKRNFALVTGLTFSKEQGHAVPRHRLRHQNVRRPESVGVDRPHAAAETRSHCGA